MRRWWPWIVLATIVVAAFTVRLAVLNKYPAPPNPDPGNHLSILHAFHGNDVTGYNLKYRYPPLYFLLVLDPLTKLLPVFTALKISAALVASIVAIPFFLLARKITGSNTIAILTAGLYCFNEANNNMMIWGTIPNLLAIFFMLWSAYYIVDAVKKGSRRSAVLAGLFLSLTVGTHHLTAPYYITGLFLSALLLLAVKRSMALSTIKILVVVVIIGAALSLPYLPTYVSILSNSSIFVKSDVVIVPEFSVNMFKTAVKAVFMGSAILWLALTAVGFFGFWKICGNKFALVFVSSLGLSSPILSLVIGSISDPFRPFFFIFIPILLAFSGFILYVWGKKLVKPMKRKKLYRALFLTFLAVITSILLSSSYSELVVAVDYYHVLDEKAIAALDWLRENTTPNTITITNNMRLAWWVEGYALRKCYMLLDKPVKAYKSQWQEMNTATKIIAGNNVVENGYLRVADFFPAGFYNPMVSINLGSWHWNIIYFNDTDTALDSKAKAMQLNLTLDRAVITYTYVGDDAVITRIVEVTHAPQVTITYNVTLINFFVQNFEFNQTIGILRRVKIASYNVDDDNNVRLTLMEPWGRTVNVKISLLETNSESTKPPFLAGARAGSGQWVRFFRFRFNATSPNLYMKFLVSVEPEVQLRHSIMEYFNAYELLRVYNIKYVVLDEDGLLFQRDVYRFTYDPRYFKPVFKNGRILILKVVEE